MSWDHDVWQARNSIEKLMKHEMKSLFERWIDCEAKYNAIYKGKIAHILMEGIKDLRKFETHWSSIGRQNMTK